MRLINPLLIVSFICLSCAKVAEIDNSNINRNYSDYYVEQAINAYRSFFPETKSQDRDVEKITYIIENQDTLAVNIDFTNEDGFVFLKKSGIPLMIVSEGNLLEAREKVPAFDFTYKILLNRLSPGLPNPIDSSFTEIVYTPLSDTVVANVPPLIDVNMHQFYPFNMFTPNAYAGCTPVAMAQAFSVFDHPDSISVTFNGSGINSTELSWTNMKSHLFSHSNSCVYCNQNGYLLREIGHRCSANYNQEGTTAWPSLECFNSFGYTATNGNTYDGGRIVSSLASGYPVVISGQNENTAHSWNIDGYYSRLSVFSVDTMRGTIVLEHNWTEHQSRIYMHFNYGWGGYSNGYVMAYEGITEYYDDGTHYSYTPKTIFDNNYNIVTMLVTHIKPIENET